MNSGVRPDLVVVDFAGTTMRDDGAILRAYRQALREESIPFTEDDLASLRGATKRAVFEELAVRDARQVDPLAVAERALATFEAVLRAEYTTGDIAEISGAAATMRLLQEHGIKVTLSTGFDRALVTVLLGRLGWDRLFDLVLTGDDVPLGRPAPFLVYRAMIELVVPDVSRVAVVGDTPLDLQAATTAHAGWTVGVMSGAHDWATLRRQPHTHLIPSVADLPAVFGLENG